MTKRKPRLIETRLKPGQGIAIFRPKQDRSEQPETVSRRTLWARRLYRRLGFARSVGLRKALNRLTRGKVGLHSTVEHYSDGPAAKVVRYEQYNESAQLSCPRCDWSGPARRGSSEIYESLLEINCPRCDRMLLIVGW